MKLNINKRRWIHQNNPPELSTGKNMIRLTRGEPTNVKAQSLTRWLLIHQIIATFFKGNPAKEEKVYSGCCLIHPAVPPFSKGKLSTKRKSRDKTCEVIRSRVLSTSPFSKQRRLGETLHN